MKKTKSNLINLSLFVFGLTGVHAQEVITTTGGDATGSGGSSSYSIGQVIYTTNTGSNGSVAQGVQQPYEISVVVGLEDAAGIDLSISAYPNPTMDFLTLKIEDFSSTSLSYQLYDLNGKKMDGKDITDGITTIEMVNYPPASYFLKVMNNQTEVKIYKIIKN